MLVERPNETLDSSAQSGMPCLCESLRHVEQTMPVEQINDALESSLQSAISSLWEKRELFSDLTLKSTDGKTIPVHKSILAARSPFFERLLYGDFSESKKLEVELGYQDCVLQEIVQYCYTDQSSLLKRTLSSTGVQLAGSFMELHVAADYFGITKLCSNISNLIVSQIEVDPTLSWLFMGVDYRNTIMQKTARNYIRTSFLKTIAEGIPSLVDLSLIKTVLTDSNVMVKEINKFRLIQIWLSNVLCNNNAVEAENPMFEDDPQPLKPWNRQGGPRLIAIQLIKTYVDLDRILPVDLEQVVERSELVTQSTILKLYKQCALAARQHSTSDTVHLRIVVSGASQISVNGIYNYNGVYDTVASFSKAGSWKGHEETFLLFCCRLSDETDRWYISIAPIDINPGTSKNTDLYYTTATGDLSKLPDSDKWMNVVENGIEPSQTVTVTYECDPISDSDQDLFDQRQHTVDDVQITMHKEISSQIPMQNYEGNLTKSLVWSYLTSVQYYQHHYPKRTTYGRHGERTTITTKRKTIPLPLLFVFFILSVQATIIMYLCRELYLDIYY